MLFSCFWYLLSYSLWSVSLFLNVLHSLGDRHILQTFIKSALENDCVLYEVDEFPTGNSQRSTAHRRCNQAWKTDHELQFKTEFQKVRISADSGFP